QLGIVALRKIAMQVCEIVRIANRDDSLHRGAEVEAMGMEAFFVDHLEIELFGLFAVRVLRLPVNPLRDFKYYEESERERDSGHRCNLLGEQIHHRGDEQHQEGEREP